MKSISHRGRIVDWTAFQGQHVYEEEKVNPNPEPVTQNFNVGHVPVEYVPSPVQEETYITFTPANLAPEVEDEEDEE